MKRTLLSFILILAPCLSYAAPNDPLSVRVNTLALPQGGTSHQVVLTWTPPVIPSGSTCVLAGYNVKRSLATGTEVTIASPTTATYTDNTVVGGQTYFYVVTATAGTTCSESGPSNEVSVQIPLDQIGNPTGLAVSSKK